MTKSTYEIPIAHQRRALITGGASGFGLAIAERLLQVKASVAIADINADALERARSRLGSPVLTIRMDVSDPTSVTRGTAEAAQALGGIDTVVTCAGVCVITPVEDISAAEWDHVVGINLKGTFLVCQAAFPYLRASKRGRVVTISSVAGRRGWRGLAHYVSSKFGVVGLTQVLALECASDGATVNSVLPSSTPDTMMGAQIIQQRLAAGEAQSPEDLMTKRVAAVPLNRLGTVADTADMVMYLISDHAGYITGQSFVVDGGGLLS